MNTRWLVVGTVILLLAFLAASAVALQQHDAAEQARTEAQIQRQLALSREVAANAVALLPTDAELSLLLAVETAKQAPTAQAEDALRQALRASSIQTVLRGHTDQLTGAAFSPDGRLIVTSSRDHSARLWDARTGRTRAELHGHTAPVTSAAFSPDGKQVVTASLDGTARLWDTTTGSHLSTIQVGRELYGAIFSPDGQWIAINAGAISGWDPTTGRQLLGLSISGSNRLDPTVFSPDGKLLVTAAQNGTAQVWEISDPFRLGSNLQPRVELREHTAPVIYNASFSPDGTRIVTAGDDGTARVWDALTGRGLVVLRAHTRAVTRALFSPDSKLIVTASEDHTLRLWDASSGHSMAQLVGHSGNVFDVAFSPDGRLLLSASDDGTARLWDAASGRSMAVLGGHTAPIWRAAFSPDGKLIVTASFDGTARVWSSNVPTATVLRGHTDTVRSVAFSPDGKLVLTASADKTARLWDRDGNLVRELRWHTAPVLRAAFSLDGRLIVTASLDRSALVWNALTGEVVTTLPHPGAVDGAAFSLDGTLVATNSADQTRVWDLSTALVVGQMPRTGNAVAFSPDGKWLVTGTDVREVSTGRVLVELRGLNGSVLGAAFSRDGRTIVTASFDGAVRLWDATSGRNLFELRGPTKLYSAALSPDQQFIAAAGEDGSVYFWDLNTRQIVSTLPVHTATVNDIVFSPDGKSVATASEDGTVGIVACEWCGTLADLLSIAQARTTRPLTPAERRQYLHEPQTGTQ